MPESVIAYDRELPEIPGRLPWEPPTSFLVKDPSAPGGWRIDDSGRRPSKMLLVARLRTAVDAWRAQGYPGAAEVTKRLFEYWFDEDHEVPGFRPPFRYYFCQREAIETLVYLVEIARIADTQQLIGAFATVVRKDLPEDNIVFETTMGGRRRVRRFDHEAMVERVQDLPPEQLLRYAFKMATGSGKTWVMAMAVVWGHFHKRRVPGSALSTNFLIVAPNVIVYQRLARDFASNAMFNQLPLIPPEWRGSWSQKVIVRGESTEPDPSGNLFLTNIQQIFESRGQEWTPQNAVDALLGRRPVKDLASQQRSMLERLKNLPDLVVLNDEAHHVHDEGLAWHRSLMTLHAALPHGLALWLDFSATPKDQAGLYFPWTVVDYPLAQAVEDRIVKAPLIVTREDDPRRPNEDPEHITRDNVTDKYGFWLTAAVERWKAHYEVYEQLGTRPVLFITAEKNAYADAIGRYLVSTDAFGFDETDVLVIHTDAEGEITKRDLDKAREAVHRIDEAESPIKVIVSVMMLREGWDVRNVTVVLGLRPFTAAAEILPEQVIGRGLRLMTDVGADRTQTLEVLGTRHLLEFLRTQLEAEGVGVGVTRTDPPKDVVIEPIQERMAHDIAIPLTQRTYVRNVRALSTLDPLSLAPIFDAEVLDEPHRNHLLLEFATTQTEVHQVDILSGALPMAQELIASIANKVQERARLTSAFAALCPIVRSYLAERCFGRPVDVDSEHLRSHLREPWLQDGIAEYLSREIGTLTVEKRPIAFENANFTLSQTKPFRWRRNLPALVATRTVFNLVATYNDYERRFAEFLDAAPDVLRFASLGTTEQGESNTRFRVDYLKSNGAIGMYFPDWVAVQQTDAGEVNWILETKGRVFPGTEAKDAAMHDWCERVSAQTSQRWRFARVNQVDFERRVVQALAELVGERDEPGHRLWDREA